MITLEFILSIAKRELEALYNNQSNKFPSLVGKKFYFVEHDIETKSVILYSSYTSPRGKQYRTNLVCWEYDEVA